MIFGLSLLLPAAMLAALLLGLAAVAICAAAAGEGGQCRVVPVGGPFGAAGCGAGLFAVRACARTAPPREPPDGRDGSAVRRRRRGVARFR